MRKIYYFLVLLFFVNNISYGQYHNFTINNGSGYQNGNTYYRCYGYEINLSVDLIKDDYKLYQDIYIYEVDVYINGVKVKTLNNSSTNNKSYISSFNLDENKTIKIVDREKYYDQGLSNPPRIEENTYFYNINVLRLNVPEIYVEIDNNGMPNQDRIYYVCNNSTIQKLKINGIVTGNHGQIKYKWINAISEDILPGGNSSTCDITNIIGQKDNYYNLIVSDDYCTEYEQNNPIQVIKLEMLKIDSIQGDNKILKNTKPQIINVYATGANGDYVYKWYKSVDGINYYLIEGENSSTYQEANNLTKDTWYKVNVTDIYCGETVEGIKKINVVDSLDAGIIGYNKTICPGMSPGYIQFVSMPSGGLDEYSYQWLQSLDGENFTDIYQQTGTQYLPPNLLNDTWYKVKVTSGNEVKYTNTIKISIADGLNVPSLVSERNNLCYNTDPGVISLNGNPSGGMGSYTYEWQFSYDGNQYYDLQNSEVSTSYVPGNMTQTKWYRVLVKNQCENKYTTPLKIDVYDPIQPGELEIEGSNEICYNETPGKIRFKTLPSGGDNNYTYQWEKSINYTNFTNIENETGTEFQETNGLINDVWYRVNVKNSCGEVVTDRVHVKVIQPIGNVVIGDNEILCYGSTPQKIELKEPINGGTENKSYKWERRSSQTGNSWEEIYGATQNEYQPVALTSKQEYRLRVIDACEDKYSNTVAKDMYNDLNAGIIGEEQVICYNTQPKELTFNNMPSEGSGEYTLQWLISEDNVNYTEIENANKINYQPEELTRTTYYKVRVTDTNGCGAKETNVVKITVLPQVNPGYIGNSSIMCYNEQPNLLTSITPASGGDGFITYQWQYNMNGEWLNISGAISESYQPEALLQTRTFRRMANSNGCEQVPSNSVTITVREELIPGAIGNNQTIVYGEKPSLIVTTQSAKGGSQNYTYQWQVSEDEYTWANIANAVQEYYQPDELYKTTHYRRLVKDEECGEAVSNVVTITVLSSLDAGTIGENQTICYGATPEKIEGTEASGGTGAYIYKWYKSNDDNIYTLIPGANGKDYQPGPLEETTYFKREVENNGTEKYSNIVTINVLPSLVEPETNIKESYCKGDNIEISVENIQNNYQYLWYDINMEQKAMGNKINIGEVAKDTIIYIKAKDNSNQCYSTFKQLKVSIDDVSANFTADKFEVRQNEPVQFYNESEGAVAYIWDFGDGVTSTEKEPIYYYQKIYNGKETIYTVKLKATSINGCEDEMVKENYIKVLPASTTGIESNNQEKTKIYPIPFSDELNVERQGKYTYEVTNMVGEIIKMGQAEGKTRINIESTPGMYILVIRSEESIETYQIIKK